MRTKHYPENWKNPTLSGHWITTFKYHMEPKEVSGKLKKSFVQNEKMEI